MSEAMPIETKVEQPLTREAFSIREGVQPYNNFYFYFLDEEAASFFYDIYRGKEWFKKFYDENQELVDEITKKVSATHSKGGADKAQALMTVEDDLYKAYMTARSYASDEVLFQ